MGLARFIAKTLLERGGAELSFANGSASASEGRSGPRTGAIVEVVWPRDSIVPPASPIGIGIGENRPFDA